MNQAKLEESREWTVTTDVERRLPIGAEPLKAGGVSFRVWAPRRRSVEVVFEGSASGSVELEGDADGYFHGVAPDARAGMRYRFRLDGSDNLFPDPVSRFQPDGPHGPSEIVDPDAFNWTDQQWRGIGAAGQVLYEMHIGTFTREGTWAAATAALDHLADLGVTCLEVMPVPEFAGRWGWGYDGVLLFAPFHHYGSPDDMRRFIDRAHALGIGVILDVVYNHFGPDGNYLREFSEHYFNKEHTTDWGDAINFDGEQNRPVREFFLANVRHWIEEYHLDGFRFDATQAIVDASPTHILADITRQAKRSAGPRSIYLTNENEPQETRLVRPLDDGGYGMDSLWNDDFHHSAMVALSGRNEAYYTDYLGHPQEFISAAKHGYLFQGQRYKWQKRRRGTPALDLPPTAFVHFIQNHDQIANSGRGFRAHQISGPAHLKAITAAMLLMPQTPMLFQGQEFAASSTFHYFADHNAELSKMICKGRLRELSQFPSVATEGMAEFICDPSAEETFRRSKIDIAEREKPFHAEIFRLHQDLIRLRRDDPAFRRVQRRGDIDGAVLDGSAFMLRFFATPGDTSGNRHISREDRLLIVNLGMDLDLAPAPEPLLAPPPGMRWSTVLSTEDPRYGGSGTPPLDTELEGWHIPGRCAVVLRALPAAEAEVPTRFRVEGSAQAARKREEAAKAAESINK